MSRKKEKVKLFERVQIDDVNFAKTLLEKEEKKFKIKLVVTCIALFGTIVMLLGQTDIVKHILFSPIDEICGVIYFIGILGTFLTGPQNFVKLIWKIASFCYWIVPFFLIDLIGFLCGFIFSILILGFCPVVFAAYNLYITYLNKKDAETFLAMNNASNGYYNN